MLHPRLVNAVQPQPQRGARATPAFSLLDLLVCVMIIGLLMAIMLPVLSHVTEVTKRVICRSNIRQVGLGVQLFAEANKGRIPPSVFQNVGAGYLPQQMMTLHTGTSWDGLGRLFVEDYINTPEIYYCPSHKGRNTFESYKDAWAARNAEIVGNYHYRGVPAGFSPNRAFLPDLDPTMSLIADGMQSIEDINHKGGLNILRADLSVDWFEDANHEWMSSIPAAINAPNAAYSVAQAWWVLDTGRRAGFPGLPNGGLGGGEFVRMGAVPNR